ncbi:cathelicidin-related antimicrobial peptide Bf-CRAMP-like [Mixophyes fleayi]|uniref:cathelicidin-related antimicrobial peptide Bf-CRAMP-like n=1 Tax=Mixophyes fleayi TaxID=3061075 RepID=UPI003F4E12BA
MNCIKVCCPVSCGISDRSQSFNMEKALTMCLVLGAIAVAASVSVPTMQWTEDDISVMSMISTDYYNKVSRENAVYALLGNNSEYIMDEASRCHQLQFTVKETLCQKADNEITEECAFRADGVVKSCTASFFVDEDRDVVVVTCDNVPLDHTREKRSSKKSSKRGGRGGKGGIKIGSGSAIAGVGKK